MEFRKWLETYTHELGYLRDYLKDQPIDLANEMWAFLDWGSATAILRRLRISKKRLEKEREDSSEAFYELADKIEKAMTPKEKEEFANVLMQQNAGDAPTWMHMHFEKIVRPTWLIHFSDDADDIIEKGFKYGTDDMTKLGLTTWWKKEAKRYGGYNFAFEANSRYALRGEKKYGKNAIMFWSAGVSAYHWGDEEDQVIFWGPSVDRRRMVYLYNSESYGWCVRPYADFYKECAYSGELENVIAWVMQNYDQYRRILSPQR